jgi:hypothetical protein
MYETFTILLYTWRNLYVAIGIAQLSNKMVLYSTDQKVFVIKTFYSSGVAVARQCHQEFSVYVALSRNSITDCQFKETEALCDKCARKNKHSTFVQLSVQHRR